MAAERTTVTREGCVVRIDRTLPDRYAAIAYFDLVQAECGLQGVSARSVVGAHHEKCGHTLSCTGKRVRLVCNFDDTNRAIAFYENVFSECVENDLPWLFIEDDGV